MRNKMRYCLVIVWERLFSSLTNKGRGGIFVFIIWANHSLWGLRAMGHVWISTPNWMIPEVSIAFTAYKLTVTTSSSYLASENKKIGYLLSKMDSTCTIAGQEKCTPTRTWKIRVSRKGKKMHILLMLFKTKCVFHDYQLQGTTLSSCYARCKNFNGPRLRNDRRE